MKSPLYSDMRLRLVRPDFSIFGDTFATTPSRWPLSYILGSRAIYLVTPAFVAWIMHKMREQRAQNKHGASPEYRETCKRYQSLLAAASENFSTEEVAKTRELALERHAPSPRRPEQYEVVVLPPEKEAELLALKGGNGRAQRCFWWKPLGDPPGLSQEVSDRVNMVNLALLHLDLYPLPSQGAELAFVKRVVELSVRRRPLPLEVHEEYARCQKIVEAKNPGLVRQLWAECRRSKKATLPILRR